MLKNLGLSTGKFKILYSELRGIVMKKVLIIAYYFPPLGWSGVQRTLKFVKYLRAFGWEPIVVTVGKTKFSVLDKSLLEEIPQGIEMIRIDDVKFKDITDEMKADMRKHIKNSFNIISDEKLKIEYEKEIESIFEKLRSYFLLPDGNAAWANNVIEEISNKLNLADISVVYTTSGPYSTHLIGYYLKKEFNLPWVTDFRDEWTNNPYYNFNVKDIRYKIEQNLEQNLVDFSDKVITTTSMATDNYTKLFNINKNKAVTITNGYDEEDFICLSKTVKSEKFNIISNGSFYLGRNPYTFLKAIENILRKNLIREKSLNIQFVGTIEDKIECNIEEFEMDDIVICEGYLPHIDSLNRANNANLLLLIVGKEDKVKSIFPGKIFEYIRMKKPILAISPKGGVVEKLLKETGCGINVEYDNIEEIENVILKFYYDWFNNKPLMVNEKKIKEYERKRLTEKLSNIFYELTE